MVGYDKNDSMTPTQKLFAGTISGIMTRFITQPLDILKLRSQLEKSKRTKKPTGALKTATKILKKEGIRRFWHGHNIGQVHSILAISSQFYVYELATRCVVTSNLDEGVKKVLNFASGVFAGCCSSVLVLPLDVLRVRQMLAKEQYRGFFNGVSKIYKSGGVLAFYEGFSASLFQMGLQVGISFSVFSFVQPLILDQFHDCKGGECHRAIGNSHKPEYVLLASSLAASVSGFVSKSITYPFDLAKRRMQISTHVSDDNDKSSFSTKNLIKCRHLFECLIKTYKKEGAKGLFRGWKVATFKTQVTSVIAFSTYELVCYMIREVTNDTKNQSTNKKI